jgi:hexokinase
VLEKYVPHCFIFKDDNSNFKHFVNFFAQIREYCRELLLSDAQTSELMNRLLEDIQLGLGKDTHASSIVKCFVTYVQDLPNGTGKLRDM